MQSKAKTVAAYLAELPEDRRAALGTGRRVFLDNLDDAFEEGMSYGMIGYYVPHRVFPAGYHCDPSKPLPFAGLASQKGNMALYLMCFYLDTGERDRFTAAWMKAGKKLDAGKSCIRFKKVEDLSLDVLAATLRRITARKFIATYEASLAATGKSPKAKAAPKAKSKANPPPPSPPAASRARA